MCVCVCACVRVCVCARAREREREGVCARACACVYVRVCVWESERAGVSARVPWMGVQTMRLLTARAALCPKLAIHMNDRTSSTAVVRPTKRRRQPVRTCGGRTSGRKIAKIPKINLIHHGFQDPINVFVRHRTKNCNRIGVVGHVLKVLCQGSACMRVVSHIQDDRGLSR